MNIPTTIFIIPYRNRIPQKAYFEKYFEERVSKQPGMEFAEYYFVHQKDNRPFNRGAIKNIGFKSLCIKYPNWRDITFVFHDIDQYPKLPLVFPYITEIGSVKHYFGFKNTLGGVLAIKGSDFSKTNGFPMFWGWGYEDNEFQSRVEASNIKIDRTDFIDGTDLKQVTASIITLSGEGNIRGIIKEDVGRFFNKTTEGFKNIRDLEYAIEDHMIDVVNFNTSTKPGKLYEYDMRSGEKNLLSYIAGKNVIIRNRKWGLNI